MNRFNRNPRDQIHPAVMNWRRRVKNNGGNYPSPKTMTAVNRFYQNILNRGLVKKMKIVNCVVPDNLIAAGTPLIVGVGFDPWVNHNWVAADLSINGLQGRGNSGSLSHYFDTGMKPTSAWSDDTTGGMTLYNVNPVFSTDGASTMGCQTFNGVNAFEIYFCLSDGKSYHDCWNNTSGSGRFGGITINGFVGYLSNNRTSATNHSVYQASSTLSHRLLGSNTATGGSRPNLNVYFGSSQDVASNAGGTTKILSFAACHDGLTATESSMFFDCIHLMRKEIGGGWA